MQKRKRWTGKYSVTTTSIEKLYDNTTKEINKEDDVEWTRKRSKENQEKYEMGVGGKTQ